MKKVIATNQAPAAIGPYSQAIFSDNTLYISGQLPIDPTTGKIEGDIKVQTEQAFKNIKAILKEAGLTIDHVVKTTVLLKEIKDFAGMNEVYNQQFAKDYPARSAFAVNALPKPEALVEIEVIACK